MKIALAQLAPVWLDRAATLAKIIDYVNQAADQKAELVVFGETLLPGYPFWLDATGGSRFDDQRQKEIHAHYLKQAVCLEDGDLDALTALARSRSITVWVNRLFAWGRIVWSGPWKLASVARARARTSPACQAVTISS